MVIETTNKRHFQIRISSPPLWHKENMINLGVKYSLPLDWQAMSWADADVEFDSAHWALDTLKVLVIIFGTLDLHGHVIVEPTSNWMVCSNDQYWVVII